MHWSASSLNRIVSSVRELKQKCSDDTNELKLKYEREGTPLVYGVEPAAVSDMSVAAVDSGFSVKQFVSVDVMLLRSVGCVFRYSQNSSLASTSFYPSRVPGIFIHSGIFSGPAESTAFRSLIRLNAELSCALQTVKIHSPQLLLIDGSLLPLASDKPPSGGGLENLYNETMELYTQLFQTCSETGIILAGIVKDPHSQRLCTILSRDYPEIKIPSNDAFTCHTMLLPFQRTTTFSYADNVSDVAILRDLGNWPRQVKGFYMKAGGDLPYRVEFISKSPQEREIAEAEAAELASKLLALGSAHAFAYPSILIEVDLRAALTPKEISAVFSSLSTRSMTLSELRSNSRPFR